MAASLQTGFMVIEDEEDEDAHNRACNADMIQPFETGTLPFLL